MGVRCKVQTTVTQHRNFAGQEKPQPNKVLPPYCTQRFASPQPPAQRQPPPRPKTLSGPTRRSKLEARCSARGHLSSWHQQPTDHTPVRPPPKFQHTPPTCWPGSSDPTLPVSCEKYHLEPTRALVGLFIPRLGSEPHIKSGLPLSGAAALASLSIGNALHHI